MPDYTKPPAMESGGGGLVSTTMDYARFSQMITNKGELDGVRILSPASVELMGTNVIPKSVLVSSNGTSVARFNEAVGFGLDFQVVNDARARAVEAGARAESVTLAELEETPLSYLPGNAMRIAVKVVGDLAA